MVDYVPSSDHVAVRFALEIKGVYSTPTSHRYDYRTMNWPHYRGKMEERSSNLPDWEGVTADRLMAESDRFIQDQYESLDDS